MNNKNSFFPPLASKPTSSRQIQPITQPISSTTHYTQETSMQDITDEMVDI